MKIQRYPHTTDKSLQAWNAADELILKFVNETDWQPNANLLIFNDRFGYLSLNSFEKNPISVIESSSQKKALELNSKQNGKRIKTLAINSFSDEYRENPGFVFMKIPKSLELFRYYLSLVSKVSNPETVVLCGFMTKYYSDKMLEIAGEFFSEVKQTKAEKKARLMILKSVKIAPESNLLSSIPNDFDLEIKQLPGVFGSEKIDIGTRFLLENLTFTGSEKRVLDMASGNGIIAAFVGLNSQVSEIHLVDDSILAIESSKLNCDGNKFVFNNDDGLENYENDYFDLIITNPPFHVEHENTMEIALSLFGQAKVKLRKGGKLIIVANRHLNYAIHLRKIFDKVLVTNENQKFELIECVR